MITLRTRPPAGLSSGPDGGPRGNASMAAHLASAGFPTCPAAARAFLPVGPPAALTMTVAASPAPSARHGERHAGAVGTSHYAWNAWFCVRAVNVAVLLGSGLFALTLGAFGMKRGTSRVRYRGGKAMMSSSSGSCRSRVRGGSAGTTAGFPVFPTRARIWPRCTGSPTRTLPVCKCA
jgi:hypothetical protein